MKRYLLFTGDRYYPSGGFSDFNDDADTVNELVDKIRDEEPDWAHVFDSMSGTIVATAGEYEIHDVPSCFVFYDKGIYATELEFLK